MKNFNAFKVYVRAVSLMISLTLVLSIIGYLQGGSFKHFIDAKSQDWGLTQAKPLPNGKSQSYRLCRTRIESVEWSNHARIFEDSSAAKARWMSQVAGAVPRELDSLEVEKWFGINCVIKVFKLASLGSELSKQPDYLLIKFVDGTLTHIKKSAGSEFLLDQDFFRSPELLSSLRELYNLGGIDLQESK